MALFVVDPAGELVGVFGGVFGEFDNLEGRFLDSEEVGMHLSDHVVIVINSTGDLAVRGEL